ncbi:glycosyltransferase, partial [bacterium]|nr:glycosyltransferase [bacterium]
MANILIFNSIVPYPAEFNGNTIRVLPLSRELAKRHCCYLVAFGKEDEASQKLRESRAYEDVALLSPPDGRRSLTRHFHIKTGNQTRVALPTEFRRIVRTLKQYVDKWRIDLAIIHTSSLAEYVEAFKEFPMVLDAIDCNTLALGRKWRQELSMHGLIEAIKSRLVLERCRFLESRLTNIFDLVTVVSPVDRDYLRGLCPRGGERIIDIPNGVSPAVFDDRGKPTEVVPGGIAFWGALDFPPNTSAVHYFYDEVFLPFLAGKDIIWYIIGKNP